MIGKPLTGKRFRVALRSRAHKKQLQGLACVTSGNASVWHSFLLQGHETAHAI
jgi:hypothetical protein